MKKSICLSVVFLVAFSYYGATQCCLRSKSKKDPKSKSEAQAKCQSKTFSKSFSKSVSNSKWMPFVGPSLQANLIGSKNPLAFVGGIEKPVFKHVIVGSDIQFFKSNYENWCDDHRVGNYTRVIPSVRVVFDPGKIYKGVFVGAGLGYAFVNDQGTKQAYTTDKATGLYTYQGTPVNGSWYKSTIAPSVSLGAGFKLHRIPIGISNTFYFGDTGDGTPLSIGLNLRVGLSKVPKERSRSCGSIKTKSSEQKSKSNSSHRSCCMPKIKI
jgi:hypothetical protein